jgi:hypothetical protein
MNWTRRYLLIILILILTGCATQLLIPLNSAIYSDGKRPLVPIETGHPLSERSDAGVMIFYTILKLSQV